MGNCASGCGAEGMPRHYFVANTRFQGQSASAQGDFEKLRIRKGDLDRLYSNFLAMDVKGRGLVEMPAFYRFMGIAPSAYAERVFLLFDEGGDGLIDFHDFVVIVWNYCGLDSSALVRFAHMLYDTNVSGFISQDQLRDMVRQMFGDAFTQNPKVMCIFAEAGFGDKVSYDHFADVARKYPYLLFPAFQMQSAIRRAVLGEAFWEAHFEERARRGNAATYSVFDVLEAMRAARVRADGGEMAVALQGRYVPAHLRGNPDAAAAAEVAEDPRMKGMMRRAELGLPPAAGDADLVLDGGPPLAKGGLGPSQVRADASSASAGDGDANGGSTFSNFKTLQGKAHAPAVLAIPGVSAGAADGARGRRGSKLATVQERAALMAVGR